MHVDWTASGACTSGWTAHLRGATRRACGGAGTMSTASGEGNDARVLRRLDIALRRERGVDDALVRVHVRDGKDADARRLDDVDGVDADARTNVARRRRI